MVLFGDMERKLAELSTTTFTLSSSSNIKRTIGIWKRDCDFYKTVVVMRVNSQLDMFLCNFLYCVFRIILYKILRDILEVKFLKCVQFMTVNQIINYALYGLCHEMNIFPKAYNFK